jgi:hypothetical protein
MPSNDDGTCKLLLTAEHAMPSGCHLLLRRLPPVVLPGRHELQGPRTPCLALNMLLLLMALCLPMPSRLPLLPKHSPLSGCQATG